MSRRECFQGKRGVGNRDVLEERLALLERATDGGDGDIARVEVVSCKCGEGRGDFARELSAERRREGACLRVPAEDEERECTGVTADRRLGRGGSGVERPESGLARVRAGDEQRLQRADRPSPCVRRGAGVPALAITRGRPKQPLPGTLRVLGHEEREPGRPRRVRELNELPLVEIPSLPSCVSRRGPLVMPAPVHQLHVTLATTWRTTTGGSGSRSRRRTTRPACSTG